MNRKNYLGMACLVLGIWLLGTARTIYGQGHTWIGEGLTQMVEGARWRIGRLGVNAAFTLANAGHDSDVYYGYFQSGEVPDWTFAASAPVQVIVPLSKNVILDLSDTPQYLFYLDTVRERAWNNTFRGQLHVALERVYMQAGGGLANVRRRFSPELDINLRERRDSLDGMIVWQAAKATSFAVLYGRTRFEYEDIELMGTSLADMLNRNEDLLDVIAYTQPSPQLRPFLDGQYGVYTFTGGGPGLRDAKSYGVFGGIEFVPRTGEIVAGTGFRGAFRLGYLRLEIADPGQPDGSGFTGEADVTIDVARRTSIHALFSRGFEFSIHSGASYYLSTRYGGGLLQRLSRRTSLSYEGLFGRLSYPEAGDVQGRRDRYAAHTLSLNLRLAHYLEAALMGTLDRRGVGAGASSRSRYFIGFSLTYGSRGRGMMLPLNGLAR